MIFGCYFFLSENKVLQFKILANITEVIAIMEGVAALLFFFIRLVPRYYNSKQLEAKSIRHFFFDVHEEEMKDEKQADKSLLAKPMKFNLCHKISPIKK